MMSNDVLSSNDHFLCTGWRTVPVLACHIMYTLIPAVDTCKILFITMFTDPRPLRTITQMPLLNLLLNLLCKCHYHQIVTHHYSKAISITHHYSAITHWGTLLILAGSTVTAPARAPGRAQQSGPGRRPRRCCKLEQAALQTWNLEQSISKVPNV